MKNEQLRRVLEKIAWKNYDPEVSINVEEMLDEMMPVIEEALSQQKEEIIKNIEERMFQIRENGEGETWKAHKELSDLKNSLLSNPLNK